jgi:asparagine synthase (glutamine-hydrolysing)
MCGVIARWGPPGNAGELRARMTAGLAAIGHRGPDGRGIWLGDDGVALGHARLAVIDVDGGAQPIANEDGSIVGVINGELYGFEAQRAELEARGHAFRTRSDSELLVHLYEEHGEAFLAHLRGEYAFVLWDGRQRRLLASRDRFGIKPLVYAHHRDELWIASEAKALFAIGVRAAWDATSFRQSLCSQYIAPTRTLFDGVHEVGPGTLLDAKPGATIARHGPALPPARDQLEIGVDIRTALEEAVVLRMRADVPVAAYLSGGLDSSLVVALAARHAPITAFGIAFDHAPYAEHRDAAAFARVLGVPFHPVPVTQDAILEHLPDAVEKSEGLCINGQLSAKFLLSRAVRDAGFKVVLAGEGADEVFFGYAHLVRDYLEGLAAAGDRDAAARLVEHDAQHATQAGIMLPITRNPGCPVWLDAKRGIGDRMRPLLAQEAELDDPVTELETTGFDPLAEPTRSELDHRLVRSRNLWSRLALAKYILRTLGDGTEMAHGIEGRLPFLDPHVVAAARRASPQQHLAGGIAKRLLREAARGILPERLCVRPKQPLLAPPITTFSTPRSADLIRDVVRGPGMRAQPWFDRERVIAWVDSLSTLAPMHAEPILMTILSTCALQQRFRL